MKQRIAVSLSRLVAAVVVLATSSIAFSAEVVPGEYLVKYKSNAAVSLMSVRAVADVRMLDHNRAAHLVKVMVNPRNEVQAIANLLKNPNVEYVTPNLVMHAFTAPLNTKALQAQWALQKVNAEAAWKRAGNRGSRSITVAVIDTGADYTHESLAPNMVAGYDFKDNTSDPMDRTQTNGNPGHGTHCSGIIGATGLIENGTVGISPEVSIMPLRFIGPDGSGDLNSAIKAIDYAISKKVRVISSSWGAAVDRSSAQPLVDAVKRADDAGIAFVVAAANDGKSNDETEVYPANAGFGNTISVAASDDQDAKPKWSNYGQRTVHVASPGLNIMSTLPNNRYGNLSGTSMATPLVAGLTAFLLAQDPSLTGAQVRALLQHTGAKVDIETACHCRIDAMTAVDTLLNKKMFIVPAAATLGPQGSVRFSTKNAKGNVTYTVANAAVGTIAADGAFTAKSAGDTTVTATDASGAQSTTLRITVGALGEQDPPAGGSAPQPPGDGGGQPPLPQPPGGGGGGGGGACPIGDAAQCQALCQIMPDLPFCSHH